MHGFKKYIYNSFMEHNWLPMVSKPTVEEHWFEELTEISETLAAYFLQGTSKQQHIHIQLGSILYFLLSLFFKVVRQIHRRDRCWLLPQNETAWGFKPLTQDQTMHSNHTMALLEHDFDPNVSPTSLAKIS